MVCVRDFPHFVEIYMQISKCIRTPDDIEMLTREFLSGQAAQNICYSEVTYTAYSHYQHKGLSFADQLAAINRARCWAEAELGVTMGLVIDIARVDTPQEGMTTAEWAISGMNDGVVALGLGGQEAGYPPEIFADAFALAHESGLPCVPHAGETVGPDSMWGALQVCEAVRIGHGVRCMEDPALVAELRDRQIPLEVCPTSNICLGVFDRFENHALPRLLDEGLYVTLNSDDPPMFDTTLTDEYLKSAAVFGLDVGTSNNWCSTRCGLLFCHLRRKRTWNETFTPSSGVCDRSIWFNYAYKTATFVDLADHNGSWDDSVYGPVCSWG